MTQTDTSALVLFSGGQDSTVCLAWALERYARVETVGFAYGQRHAVELEARPRVLARLRRDWPRWASRLGEDHMLDVATLGEIGTTAMTSDIVIEMTAAGVPNTFVPGRNLVFFTYAAALGYRRGIHTLIGGMCETDYSGYPDCRRATLDAMQSALGLALERPIAVETPLMQLTKAQTWSLAHDLGGTALIDLIVEHTHTCYEGDRSRRHDWGYGCGACPACVLRAKGWAEWRGP